MSLMYKVKFEVGDKMISIKHYETKDELRKGFTVLKQLRTHLNENSFLALYHQMKQEGYKLIGIEEDGKTVAVTGIIILTNLYNGKHVFVYDLVTDESNRSKGYGEQLLNYVHEYGKQNGCGQVVLESGLQRINAHRFYEEKMKYDKRSFAFSKEI